MIELAVKAIIPLAILVNGIATLSSIPYVRGGRILFLNPPFRRPMLVSGDMTHVRLLLIQPLFMVFFFGGLPWLSTRLSPEIANAMWRAGWLLAGAGVIGAYCLVESLAYLKELRTAGRITRREGIARLAKHIQEQGTKRGLRIRLLGLCIVCPFLVVVGLLFTFVQDPSAELHERILFMQLGLLMALITVFAIPLMGYALHLEDASVSIDDEGHVVDPPENDQSELGRISRKSGRLGLFSQLTAVAVFLIAVIVAYTLLPELESLITLVMTILLGVLIALSGVTTYVGLVMGVGGLFQKDREKRPAVVGLLLSSISAGFIGAEVLAFIYAT